MHYYEHHIGDYAAATVHLSWDEDMAYTRLLRAYYHHERGIPQGQAYRMARASTTAQRRAVDAVLAEFFELLDGVHRQKRSDVEIAKFKDKQSKAKASADARWSQSKRNANASPDEHANALQAQCEGNAPNNQTQEEYISSEAKASASSAGPTDGCPEPRAARTPIPCPYAAIVEAYHEALPMLPRARLMPDGRQRAMRKVWGWVLSSSKDDGTRRATTADEAVQWFRDYFARAAENDFLTGRSGGSSGHENWRCDIDFLLSDRGKKHVIEKTEVAA